VKTPTVARKPRTIVTPEQFDLIHHALPNRGVVELDVETGARGGASSPNYACATSTRRHGC
jgi:hypothetical protein